MTNLIRKVTFDLNDVKFQLTLWDTGNRGDHGRVKLKYILTEIHDTKRKIIFNASDLEVGVSPENDSVVDDIMGFITMMPEDTDEEYFDKYTKKQIEFRDKYAEDLKLEVMAWYEKRQEQAGE